MQDTVAARVGFQPARVARALEPAHEHGVVFVPLLSAGTPLLVLREEDDSRDPCVRLALDSALLAVYAIPQGGITPQEG